jgi:hypothetical protein
LSRGLGVLEFYIEAGRTVVCNVSRTLVALAEGVRGVVGVSDEMIPSYG